jgi:hypothetical protein
VADQVADVATEKQRADRASAEFAAKHHLAGEGTMSLVTVVVVLIVVGVLLWLINAYIPMQGTIKRILNAVVVIAVVIWLLQAFGLLGELSGIRVGS